MEPIVTLSMCFSAIANFVVGGVLGCAGVFTLSKVRRRSEVLLGSLPLLFGIHQGLEGVVWLGVRGRVTPATLADAVAAYILFAQALLPMLIPASIWLIERAEFRRRRMFLFEAIGIGLGLYVLWALTRFDTRVFERGHSIVYDNPGTRHWWLGIPYVAATCGAMLCSGHRYIIFFGIANLVGLVATIIIKAAAFTSIWCLYAAIVSVIVYGYFRQATRRSI